MFKNSTRDSFIGSPRVNIYNKVDRIDLIKYSPWLFLYIENPDYEDKKKAIAALPSNLYFIKYPNIELVELAIHKGYNLSALKLLNDCVSFDVLLHVIRKYPNALQYIKKQSFLLMEAAITIDFNNWNLVDKNQFTLDEYLALKEHYGNVLSNSVKKNLDVIRSFDFDQNRLAM